MPRKPKRDYTLEEQLARGPLDLPFLMLVLLLMGIGLVMLFSASYATAYYDSSKTVRNDPLYYFKRQAVFAVAGIVAMYIISRINYQTLRVLSIPILGVSIVLLIIALTPLGAPINGVHRWVRMFLVAGPTFQPSEIAKVAVVLFFAARLSKRDTEKKRKFSNRTLRGRCMNALERIGFLELVPYGCVLLIMLVLMRLEPHMSGIVLILVGAAAVLFVSGISLGWFISLGGIAVVGLTVIALTTNYMTKKINSWLDPWSDPSDKGYQIIQSLYSIASGGFLGKGLGNSIQKMDFLPEPENDMIFSIVVEELGLLGGFLILLLFALLILRGYWIALHARDKFGTLVIVGIITLLAAQVFCNISVVTNLIPNTGISLPFFSYGGTALMIQLAEMGIVLSISRQAQPAKKD